MPRLKAVLHIIDSLSIWSGRVLAAGVYLLAGIVMFEVISRYIFNRPTIWSMEASSMVFGICMVGGGAYALVHKTHVRMDLFYIQWSKRTRAIVNACTFPFFLLFLGVTLWKSAVYGIESLMMLEHSTSTWGQPLYHLKMTIPVVILLITMQGTAEFIRNLFFALTGKELE